MADQKYNILLTASDQTKAAFESANRSIEAMSGGLISLQGLLAGVSVGAMVEMIKSTTETADQMGKAAQKIGMSTEAISQLKYAAELADVPFEALQKGLEKLSRAAYDATTIGGALSKSFEQMGIATTDSSGHLKDSSVLMSEIADKFSHMEDGSAKTALAMKLFGKAGAEMIPLLNEGSAGLKEMADEADRLGVTISSNTAAEAERFNDNLKRLHAAATGMTNQITAALLPSLNEVAAVFVSAGKDGETLAEVAGAVQFAFRALASAGAVIVFDFKVAGDTIGAVAASLGALAHGDFAGVVNIGKQLKEQIGQAKDELVDFEERLAHPPIPPALEKREGFKPTIDDAAVKSSLDKLLAASKAFDEQSNMAHEDGFNKWLTKWKEIEAQLTAEGAKGNAARASHEAAYTVYVNAENEKRLTDAGKIEAAKAKQLDAALNNENAYFAKLHAMAALSDKSAESAENLRYQDQVIEFQKTYDLAVQNHALSLAEEESFQMALADIKKVHDDKLKADAKARAQQDLATAGTQWRAMFELNKEVRTYEAVVCAREGGHAGEWTSTTIRAAAYRATRAAIFARDSPVTLQTA